MIKKYKGALSGKKGFTLIELLVVIAIIGLLSTLATVSLNSARSKARDGKRLAEMKSMQTALEMYYNDHKGYPGGSGALLGNTNLRCLDDDGFKDSGCVPTIYIQSINDDPLSGRDYSYNSAASSTYVIYFQLENFNAELNGKNCTFSNTSTVCN